MRGDGVIVCLLAKAGGGSGVQTCTTCGRSDNDPAVKMRHKKWSKQCCDCDSYFRWALVGTPETIVSQKKAAKAQLVTPEQQEQFRGPEGPLGKFLAMKERTHGVMNGDRLSFSSLWM